MIKRLLVFFALICCLSPATSTIAAPLATHNVGPRAADEDIAALEARRQILFRQMMADPSNLDVSFEYAALSSQVGDLEGAIATLERMLIFAPGLPRLQLELGVLYFRLGAFATAKTYFDAVAAVPDVPADIRAKIAAYLAQIDQGASGSRLGGVISIGGRYQTNANAGLASRTISLNGLDFILSDSALAGADFNASAALTLNYARPLSSQGDRFEAVLNGFAALYADRSALNIGVIELSGGPSFDLGRLGLKGSSFGIYALAGGALLDSSPYLATAGAGVVLLGSGSPDLRLSLRGEYRREAYADTAARPTASNRNSDRFRVVAGVEKNLDDNVTLFGSTSLERRAALVDFASLWEAGVQGGITIRYASPLESLPSPWSLTLSGSLATRLADGPDRLISTEPETGHDWTVSATNTMVLAPDLALQAQVSYRWTTSNYPTRRFDNLSAGLTLQKRF